MLSSLDSFLSKILFKNSLIVLALLCVTFFAYGNILVGDFVFDDNIFIENNLQIRSPSNVEEIYSSSTTAGSGLTGDNFYRPNQQFIYMLLYSFGGLTPFFFHLVPVLLHILNGFLIFILFTRLGISRRVSFFGSLLFLLHPILTQAVSYVSGLSEPLVASTILGTLLVFLKVLEGGDYKRFHKLLLLGSAIFAVGLFSKESQMVALPLMGIILMFKWPSRERERILRALVFIGTLAVLFLIYLYARVNFLNFTGVIGLTGEFNIYTNSVWVRISTFVHILPEYFKMMLWPWHLYYEKPYMAYDSYASVQSAVGLGIIVIGFISSIYSLWKGKGEVFLGVTWFFIALLPVSGIIPTNSMYLEHWLYIPIIGLIFCLCSLSNSLSDKLSTRAKEVAAYIFILILLLFSCRIMARNIEWGDPVKFYENEIRYTQSSARIYNNLAMELADRGDCIAAVHHYEKAILLNDSYPQTHHNLARCLEEMGQLEQAGSEYLKALYIEPNFSYSINGLYNLLSVVGDGRSRNFLELKKRIEKGQTLTQEDIVAALR